VAGRAANRDQWKSSSCPRSTHRWPGDGLLGKVRTQRGGNETVEFRSGSNRAMRDDQCSVAADGVPRTRLSCRHRLCRSLGRVVGGQPDLADDAGLRGDGGHQPAVALAFFRLHGRRPVAGGVRSAEHFCSHGTRFNYDHLDAAPAASGAEALSLSLPLGHTKNLCGFTGCAGGNQIHSVGTGRLRLGRVRGFGGGNPGQFSSELLPHRITD
jgi:hypothetical protein